MTDSLLPHQQRVIAERDQLNTRLTSLRAFIASDTFRQVDKAERMRLLRQEQVMTEFAQVLTERIDAFTAPTEDFALGKACDLSGEGGCEACQ